MNIQLTSNAAEIVARLKSFPKTMEQGIERALDLQNQFTIGYIQHNKLSQRGPTTLGVRSNRLWEAVLASAATSTSDGRIESSIGDNVRYAGVHEFGFDGVVNVRQFVRKNSRGNRYQVTSRGSRKLTASGISTVRAHQMHMKFPARAMFRTGIEERAPEYVQAVSQAIVEAWQGGKN